MSRLDDFNDEVDEYGRKAKTWFVMRWTELLKKWSVLAALLAGSLEALKLWLQDNSGDLALLTQNKYYSVATLVITFAIPILRNMRQKDPVPDVSTKPSSSTDPTR